MSYSQGMEEKWIGRFLERIGSVEHFLVDIGASDGGTASNTRFLVESGWEACRIDRNCRGADRTDKTLHQHHVDRTNIAGILGSYGVPANPGLLSIDIDGVDLFVLQSLLKAGIHPSLIVFEFNGCREPRSFDSIEYNPLFQWDHVHDYYGASWNAFRYMLDLEGYVCIGHLESRNGFAARKENGIQETGFPERWQYHRMGNPETDRWIDARTVF